MSSENAIFFQILLKNFPPRPNFAKIFPETSYSYTKMDSDPQFKKNLSQKLLRLRQEKLMTQAELARVCEIPQPVLSLYENINSNRLPTLYGIVKLANALGVSTDYLLGRTSDRQGAQRVSQDDAIMKELSSKDRHILRHVAEGLLAASRAKQEVLKRKKTASGVMEDEDKEKNIDDDLTL